MAETFTHVILVSVDGLRQDMIVADPAGPTPALARLLRGAHTLEARTDPDITITLPNHLDMLTGRFVGGDHGHAWVTNNDPPGVRDGGTLEQHAGEYIASMFDVAHDHGVATGVFVTKTKFWLLVQSYNGDRGAPDTVPPDHGRDKIDVFGFSRDTATVVQQCLAWLNVPRERSLMFLHLGAADAAGHQHGWDLEETSAYRRAISAIDAQLGLLLEAIDRSEALRGRTAIILTADHGGGDPFKSHTVTKNPVNFRIPFLIWLGTDTPAADLYDLNPQRARPEVIEQLPRDAPAPPIRNGDAGNLALRLLGLPAIPGSTINAAQDLRWTR